VAARGQNQYVQLRAPTMAGMAREIEHGCPDCDAEQSFYRTASTTLHLGTKTKWRCPECEFGLVLIDGIDSTAA
jgi:rubredoxin